MNIFIWGLLGVVLHYAGVGLMDKPLEFVAIIGVVLLTHLTRD